MNLMIVESPNKAKTIKKILKKDVKQWEVIATQGHILNLPKKELGIDYKNNDFKAKWIIENGKNDLIKKISDLAKKAEIVYIATDDDREGEKIADDVIKKANLKNYKRVTFLEITEKEILQKIKEGRYSNKNTVYSATARRLIDRYIGYPISNIIRYAFRKENIPYEPKGVGRVISPALHILVELENQIEKFIPEKQRKVSIEYIHNHLVFKVHNSIAFLEDQTRELNEFITSMKTNQHIVSYYKRKTEDREPPKPLITSTLQYGAWYLYGIKPKETMKLAQDLFEAGLISYHRTDSYRLSLDIQLNIISYLYEKYGDEYVLSNPREYKNNDSAQNAHEAIRPTTIDEAYHPDNILNIYPDLTQSHQNLYEFIWYRTLAIQMKPAIYDTSEIEIDIAGNKFDAKANHLLFDGWEILRGNLIKSSSRSDDEEWKDKDIQLPEVVIGQELKPMDIVVYDTETRRPKRYGIGRFITTLFTNGIARPSTLDGIIDNLENKGYVDIKKGILYPTELAKKVDEWLVENVSWLVDIELAKQFEEQLDEVEKGKLDFKELIKEYISYIELLEKKFEIDVLHNKPTPAQIEYIRKISKEMNIEIDAAILENKKLATDFIDKYVQKISIGKCPVCKNIIKEYEKNYSCSNRNCDFVIWKNNIDTLINNFQLPNNETFKKEFIKLIFKDKKVYFEKLTSKKGKTFAAYIVLKQNGKWWNFDLSFPKKEVPEKYIQASKNLLEVKDAANNKKLEELKKENEKLKEERRLLKNAAIKDELTRAYNRKALEEDIKKLEKYKTAYMSIAFFDGDKFKNVNDTYGHNAGDEVLRKISDIVHSKIREFNIKGRFYRYGGEEFLMIAVNANYDKYYQFLDNIRITLEKYQFNIDSNKFSVTMSIGYTPPQMVAQCETIQKAIKKADEAVYQAKEQGRNRIVVAN